MTQQLKSQDHKTLICNLMKSMLDAMTREELDSMQSDIGSGWISYKSESRWKRRSKYKDGNDTMRVFEHESMPGDIIVREIPRGPDSVAIELEMGRGWPTVFADAARRVGSFDTKIGPAAHVRGDPKDSILQGEKPAGFGDFS